MKKRKDGRYQKKVTLSDGRQRLVYGRTIAEVNQAADALRDQDRQGLAVGDTTTVDEWAKTWISTYKSGLRENTLSGYRNAYNVHILPYIATMKLQDVRPVHVREVMKAAAPYSEDMQRKILNTMRQLFTTARQNGLMVGDPAEGIKITPHARPARKEYLTLEEQEALIATLRPLEDRRPLCFVGLCLYCGRVGLCPTRAPGGGSGPAVGRYPGRKADREPGLHLSQEQPARPCTGAQIEGLPPYCSDAVRSAGHSQRYPQTGSVHHCPRERRALVSNGIPQPLGKGTGRRGVQYPCAPASPQLLLEFVPSRYRPKNRAIPDGPLHYPNDRQRLHPHG